MIVGTGIDLAEVARIRSSIERFGAKFTDRIFTPGEIAYVERKANKFERYAARFAAKEAGMKAIGTGWKRGVRWQDFEVANLPSGKPTLRLHGVEPVISVPHSTAHRVRRYARAFGIERVIAHMKNWRMLASGYRGMLVALPAYLDAVTKLEIYRTS